MYWQEFSRCWHSSSILSNSTELTDMCLEKPPYSVGHWAQVVHAHYRLYPGVGIPSFVLAAVNISNQELLWSTDNLRIYWHHGLTIIDFVWFSQLSNTILAGGILYFILFQFVYFSAAFKILIAQGKLHGSQIAWDMQIPLALRTGSGKSPGEPLFSSLLPSHPPCSLLQKLSKS